ncbi:S1 family peptidase [Lipingzhangella sp. LS1_29]|uniref:S1 family peptidase n=1 Tax=Lipingzhangella rawalii TaxID=2055835 RepID=A0ABU2HAQ1_9ACTN|nr:S1 family peptidase [Lipingzhangella rawalii]MDS1272087.1 S1 family peptidase [Lipingzhangella rawalii]
MQIEETDERPVLAQDIVGGQYYSTGWSTCSVGHAVDGGFVTAGHCGGVGTPTSSPNGTVAGSDFPGNDMAYVQSTWNPTPLIHQHGQGPTVTVAGGQEAAVGADICRSGGTTGVDCGQIEAKNQTVNYPEGTVTGMTQASVW